MWSLSTRLLSLTALTILATTALAQQNATEETGKLCSLQLHTRTGLIQRTNDWELVPSTNTTLWPAAQIYLTTEESSRMYGSDGGRCGFDPHLRCANISDFDSTKHGFYIAENGLLNFANRTVFWQCPNNDSADEQMNNAAPYLYPPIDSIEKIKLPENCTAVNLTASRCEVDQGSEFTVTPSSILTTASLTGGIGSGLVQMRTNGFFVEFIVGLVGMLLTWL
ncbi:hypothetical protein PMZ80_009727 [Knufia obscura]|uniref:Uncharacterized protein n=1 Tax=Knufia obscura TaxID=1635080 RepID=A0ABR0RD78_9EURO|nr:hypothetical protein PMZ80_009727 [Knufia obscura]